MEIKWKMENQIPHRKEPNFSLVKHILSQKYREEAIINCCIYPMLYMLSKCRIFYWNWSFEPTSEMPALTNGSQIHPLPTIQVENLQRYSLLFI